MYLWNKLEIEPLPYSKEIAKSLTTFGRYAYNAFYFYKYVGAVLNGPFGIGKSTSALHLGREIAQAIYGVNFEQGLQIALQNTLFTMEEVIEATKNLGSIDDWRNTDPYKALKKQKRLRIPFYIWDDAAMHGSKYKHFLDMNASYDLQSNFDTIRDVTGCMIMTAPENEELLHFIRGYRGNYDVEVVAQDGAYLRVLQFWKYGRDKLGRKRKYKKWVTQPFSIHIAQPYYGQYLIMKNIAKLENYERYEERKKQKEIEKQYLQMRLEKKLSLVAKNKQEDVVYEE